MARHNQNLTGRTPLTPRAAKVKTTKEQAVKLEHCLAQHEALEKKFRNASNKFTAQIAALRALPARFEEEVSLMNTGLPAAEDRAAKQAARARFCLTYFNAVESANKDVEELAETFAKAFPNLMAKK